MDANLIEKEPRNVMSYWVSDVKFQGGVTTLPETNSSPLKIGRVPNGNSSSNHQYSVAMLVSRKVIFYIKGFMGYFMKGHMFWVDTAIVNQTVSKCDETIWLTF